MTGSRVLIELVLVLGTAAVITVVFQALRLPVVLGYILAGMLIGPHVPVPLVANAGLVHILSELGVILLMFTIGLELRLSTLARVGLPAAATALFEVGLVITIGMLVARLVGFSAGEAVFAGACLGISSTMLVAKAFEELGWKGGFTEVVFAILVFEDLIAILLFAIVAAIATGAGLDAPELAILVGKLTGFLALALIGGLLVVPRAIRWIANSARRETLLIAALAVCFGYSGIAAWQDYSVALGAFIAGVVIAESGKGHAVFELVQPFRDVFAMVFFVSVGMTIDPAMLASESLRIAAFTAVVLIMKPVGVAAGAFFAGNGVRPAIRAGLSLAQIGELSFVIATIAGDARLLAIAVGVSCATTVTSPILIRNSDRIAGWLAASLPQRIGTFVSFYEGWLARLRSRSAGGGTWRKLRRPLLVLVLDAGAVTVLAIVAATFGRRALRDLDPIRQLRDWAIDGLLVLAVAVVAAPFLIGMVRRIVIISRQLAAEVIPSGQPGLPVAASPIDLGQAPRRALTLTFEFAIGLAVTVPMVTAIQPFVPGSLVVMLLVALVIVVVLRRSIRDFEGHVRAGSELILELLSRRPSPDEPKEAALAQLEVALPGFGGTVSHALGDGAAAVGRTLAQLDLRARTGATVLAIARGEHGLATPSPTEPLQPGDVLALAGSDEAIAAARTLLESG